VRRSVFIQKGWVFTVGKDANEEKARRTRRVRRSRGGTCDYAMADGPIVLAAIAQVAARGGAVRLGYTSDGGAYAIGIYGDGDPYTEYVKPSEDINEFFRELREAWDD